MRGGEGGGGGRGRGRRGEGECCIVGSILEQRMQNYSRTPTNNAPLISFLVSFDAEILLIITD